MNLINLYTHSVCWGLLQRWTDCRWVHGKVNGSASKTARSLVPLWPDRRNATDSHLSLHHLCFTLCNEMIIENSLSLMFNLNMMIFMYSSCTFWLSYFIGKQQYHWIYIHFSNWNSVCMKRSNWMVLLLFYWSDINMTRIKSTILGEFYTC